MTEKRRAGLIGKGVYDLYHDKNGNLTKLGKQADGVPRDEKPLRWKVRWVDPSGSRRSKNFAKRIDANRFADEISADLTRSEYVNPNDGNMLVKDAFEKWKSTLLVSEKSIYAIDGAWNRYISDKWGERRLATIDKSEVSAWIARLHRDGLSTKYIKEIVAPLRQIFDWAVDARRVKMNPCHDLQYPREAKKKIRIIELDQLKTLADSMPNTTDSAIVWLMGTCGLRIGEVAGLDCSDVDLKKGTLLIERSYSPTKGGSMALKATKNNEYREILIPTMIRDMIVDAVGDIEQDAPLFVTANGHRINSNNWRARHWKKGLMAARAEDPTIPKDLRPHDMRHTAASLMISVGASVKAVQHVLGHASAAMTLDVYADLFDTDRRAVADRMSDLLAGNGGGSGRPGLHVV